MAIGECLATRGERSVAAVGDRRRTAARINGTSVWQGGDRRPSTATDGQKRLFVDRTSV